MGPGQGEDLPSLDNDSGASSDDAFEIGIAQAGSRTKLEKFGNQIVNMH